MNRLLKELLKFNDKKINLENIEYLNKLIDKGIISIDYLINEVIKYNNFEYLCTIANIKNVPLDKIIDKLNNSNDIIKFVKYLPNLDEKIVNKLAILLVNINNKSKYIIDTKNIVEFVSIVENIKDEVMIQLVDSIIEKKNNRIVLDFAKNVTHINDDIMNKLVDAIILDIDYNFYQFITDVKDVPIDKFTNAIIKENNIIEMYNFINVINTHNDIYKKSKERVTKVFLELLKNKDNFNYFINNIDKYKIKMLANVIKDLENEEYNYELAVILKKNINNNLYYDVFNYQIKQLIYNTISINNINYIYKFIRLFNDFNNECFQPLLKCFVEDIINLKINNISIFEIVKKVNNGLIDEVDEKIIYKINEELNIIYSLENIKDNLEKDYLNEDEIEKMKASFYELQDLILEENKKGKLILKKTPNHID